jgi:hypothetical protein
MSPLNPTLITQFGSTMSFNGAPILAARQRSLLK